MTNSWSTLLCPRWWFWGAKTKATNIYFRPFPQQQQKKRKKKNTNTHTHYFKLIEIYSGCAKKYRKIWKYHREYKSYRVMDANIATGHPFKHITVLTNVWIYIFSTWTVNEKVHNCWIMYQTRWAFAYNLEFLLFWRCCCVLFVSTFYTKWKWLQRRTTFVVVVVV